MMSNRCTSALVMSAIATASLAARAQPAPVDEGAELFRQGREAMKGENYGGACALFEASQRIDPAPGTLLNVAVCSEKLGRLRKASSALNAFLETADPADERRARASALLADVTDRTPRLSLRIPDSVSSRAQVRLDGETVEPNAWRNGMQLDPGRHVLEVRVPQTPDQLRTLEVKERDRLVEAFVVSQNPEQKMADRQVSPATQTLPPTFYVSLGVGIAGLVTAAGSAAIVLRQRDTVESHCENKLCDAEGIAAGEQGKRFETVTAVALPVGVAGMALAGYLWFTEKKTSSPTVGITVAPTYAAATATVTY